MVGVIDEIQMPLKETDRNPILLDIKTRVRDTLPDEAQRRNGRYVYFSGFCFNVIEMRIHLLVYENLLTTNC